MSKLKYRRLNHFLQLQLEFRKSETKLMERKCENHTSTPTLNEEQEKFIITDLVAELAIILNDKANLEQEKSTLKLDNQELKQKLVDYQRNANEEKARLLSIIQKYEEKIYEKEIKVAKFQNQLIDVQNNYEQKISNQNCEYQNQKHLFDKQQEELNKVIESLKAKIVTTTDNYGNLQKLNTMVQNKYVTYKRKLKYAIDVIEQLSNSIKKSKKVMINKECQTDVKYKNACNINTCTLHSQSDLENENHILAELFFREHSTDDFNNIFYPKFKN